MVYTLIELKENQNGYCLPYKIHINEFKKMNTKEQCIKHFENVILQNLSEINKGTKYVLFVLQNDYILIQDISETKTNHGFECLELYSKMDKFNTRCLVFDIFNIDLCTNLPIPIKNNDMFSCDLECCCKFCKRKPTYDHLHCWIWNKCIGCDKKVWYNSHNCSLYSRRPHLVCFNCRSPYYKQGIKSGNIHKIFIKLNSSIIKP